MKFKFYRTLITLGVLLFCTSFISSHPIKLTSSLIEYNAEKTELQIECRVFIDDLMNSINYTFNKDINLTNVSNEDKKSIESYFKKYYVITINGKQFPLKYVTSQVLEEHNVCILKFSQNISTIKKGDQLCVENRLFFEEFDFLQTNLVTVRIPHFVEEVYFEAMSTNYSLPIDL
ncbi:DUF6702 family protein [Aquimarina sp. RZ0]|uniref:DUF6702 family protein n=1 Tax=Aquimarina sp. RZ0 TaxID=2607730 RepID=UPI0011F337F7|nr:DUF6702 family protein [Aquimarina sp. RZ0]KAA1247901.1 hypothetical protein F0000_01395 [Aquimarina sp. RZ0]